MSSNIFKPSGTGLRMPTDPSQFNGPVYNPPRYAELGGLTGPGKIKPEVNNAPSGKFTMPTITKPGGGK